MIQCLKETRVFMQRQPGGTDIVHMTYVVSQKLTLLSFTSEFKTEFVEKSAVESHDES